MSFRHSDAIEVKQVRGKGRGVFARRRIPASTEIERVPVLVLPAAEMQVTALAGHCFVWGRETVALALGYGSIYNHSYTPNAEIRDAAPRTKIFRALRDILPGEEITINYNGESDDTDPVGFDVRD